MNAARPDTRPPPGAPAVHLSRLSFGLALGIVLAIFFGLHPVWRTHDISAMDSTIWWSYVPIPGLVAALLALERKWGWKPWALETLRLTLVKFAITFLFANVLWSFVAPPGAPASPNAVAESTAELPGRFDVRDPPPATPIDPSRTGRLAGRATDASGEPQPDVLVAVTGGLQAFVFAPRPEGVTLAFEGGALRPREALVQTWERLILRGAADQLHAVRAVDESGRTLFNVPLLPGGEQTLMFDHALGRVTLSCTVHGAAEPAAELAVTGSPFAAWTDARGHFEFSGVPAGDLELTAFSPAHGRSSQRVLLAPGGDTEDLRLAVP